MSLWKNILNIMKKIIKITTINKKYSIIIEKNSILKFLNNEKKLKKKIFIIIDSKVSKILNLNNSKINLININSSEKIKSIDHYWKIISILLKLKIDRHSTIIGIGGGTIGDLSGFIASTILRGVRFILVPTTLLAQVDSSIGGKNGINSKYGKNLIGTFMQPDKVIIDPNILASLSKREIKSGYAEILKHALIGDYIFYKWLESYYKKILNLNTEYLTKAIIKSVKVKAKFIESDEKENLTNTSSRAILNFGHTFGHALEAMNNYNQKITHGEAISIGMALASKISYKLKNISLLEYKNILLHLDNIGLPKYDKRIKSNKIYEIIKSDKKNTKEKINLILLDKIGKGYFEKGLTKAKISKLLN